MFTLLTLTTITTLSLLTLWLMTKAWDVTELEEEQQEPRESEPPEGKKPSPLEAWLAKLSREPHPLASEPTDFTPPSERHPAAAAYCPRCKVEYRPGFAQCNTCEMALVMYDGGQFGL